MSSARWEWILYAKQRIKRNGLSNSQATRSYTGGLLFVPAEAGDEAGGEIVGGRLERFPEL